MAHTVRFAITLSAILAAAIVYMSWYSPWAWAAAIAVLLAGGGLAELSYRHLATGKAAQRDLAARLRKPPS